MFEKASRMKMRFQTSKGLLTVEDLWDLSLPNLNILAKDLNKQIKEEEEEDFLKVAKTANVEMKLAFDIVIHILNVKKAEKEAREVAADKAAKKAKLLEVLARKQDASLENMTMDEIKAQIDSI